MRYHLCALLPCYYPAPPPQVLPPLQGPRVRGQEAGPVEPARSAGGAPQALQLHAVGGWLAGGGGKGVLAVAAAICQQARDGRHGARASMGAAFFRHLHQQRQGQQLGTQFSRAAPREPGSARIPSHLIPMSSATGGLNSQASVRPVWRGVRRHSRDKLDTRVDFPLHGLDLSQYVLRQQGVPPVYDLYAVSNHYGSLGGGHYTAFARMPGSEERCARTGPMATTAGGREAVLGHPGIRGRV